MVLLHDVVQVGTGTAATTATELVLPLDLLQIGTDGGEGPAVFRVELRSDAKEGMNEPALPDHIALRQPPALPFPDQMHRFVTVDRP